MGDPVVCKRNLWSEGLQNGSLGRVVAVQPESQRLFDTHEGLAKQILGWIEWDDGETRPLDQQLLDNLDLAYALTVHKAQGSQWPRVIVVVTGHILLDRTLLYTALTRAQRQVILIGDERSARRAVQAAPRANLRKTALTRMLRDMLVTPSPFSV